MNKDVNVSKSSLCLSFGATSKTINAKSGVLLMVYKDWLNRGYKELELLSDVLDRFEDVFPKERYPLCVHP